MTKDQRQTRELKAIMQAKSQLPYSKDDPDIPDRLTIIEEIAKALGLLLKSGQDDMKAYQIVLSGLKSGCLVMKSLETDATIPSSSWHQIDIDRTELHSWNRKIYFPHTCIGFRGHLPVIETNDAVKWLKANKTVGKARNVGRPGEQERSAQIYYELFGDAGHAAHAVKSKAAAHRQVKKRYTDKYGKPISFSTLARAMSWKK